MSAPHILLTRADWLALFAHFLMLSLLSIGGAITTAPEVQRYMVYSTGWISAAQFNASIALAQAAPGPNLLFVALVGWNLGLNVGGGLGAGLAGWAWPLAGVVVTMAGILLPSTTLTFFATRWAHRNRELRAVRAFKQGLAPIVTALLMSTGWVLTAAHDHPSRDWPLWLLTLVAMLLVWRTRIHLLWLLGAGALLGALGWV